MKHSKAFRGIGLILGGLLLAWGILGAGLSIFVSAHPAWFSFGFELVAAIGALAALFVALYGKPSDDPLGYACAAGTILLATGFSYLASRHLGDLSLKWSAVGRAVTAGALAVLGAVIMLRPSPRGARMLFHALAYGAVLVAAAMGWVFFSADLDAWLRSMGKTAGFFISAGVLSVLGLILCLFGHCAIRAFEIAAGERRAANG